MLKTARMVQKYYVKGWEEFEKLAVSLESQKKPINVFFTGDKDELGMLTYFFNAVVVCLSLLIKKGSSWCPYCNQAKPVVEQVLESAPEDTHFIHCEIERPL